MAVLPIYTYGTPVLRQKAHPVKQVTDVVIKLIVDMFDTMHKANGVGLAATQVGSLERVIVIDVSGMEGMEEIKPLALINPEVQKKQDVCVLEEGCLSIPDVRDEVERPEIITVRYKNANFEDVEFEAGGFLARVIQHEIDHLNGVLFVDRLSSSQRESHAERLEAIRRGEMEVDYPVVTRAALAV